MRRLFFVFFSYAVRAASKVSFRLEEAGGSVFDMVTAARKWLASECMMLAICMGSTARVRVRRG